MTYLSLYRRQRPLTFGEMTGQEHVARTLSHALVRGQLAHAYLFCGPRGTGKTTAAKILARAVNCQSYPAPEPCGVCPPCRNIASGVSLDVIEMDAASTRGIDEMRELRERTRYASSESRNKVYILDEAHMLTNEACNAFLKTLEEPPPGVIFILATTDPGKLPSTIVSRCQRFDFHLLNAAQIKECLQRVAGQEGWPAEDDALRLIARLAEGSLRDALGLLEQCRAYGEETITAEHVQIVSGVTRVETIGSLIDALAAGELEQALSVLQQVTYGGRDLPLFLRDIMFYFSRLLLGGSSPTTAMEESYYGFADLLQRHRGAFLRQALLDVIELLHQVAGELRQAHYPQFVLEIALIRMLRVLHPTREHEGAGMEVPTRAGARPAPPQAPAGAAAGEAAAAAPQEESPPQPEAGSERAGPVPPEQAVPQPLAPPEQAVPQPDGSLPPVDWPRILNDVKRKAPSTHNYLKAALSQYWQGDQLVLIYAKDDFAASRIMESSHRRMVENTVSLVCRKTVRIRVILSEPEKVDPEPDKPDGKTGDHNTLPGGAGKVEEDEGSYEFAAAMELFPGQVLDLQ